MHVSFAGRVALVTGATSGIGRELGIQGLRAYQQVKHLHANPGGSRDNYIHLSALSGNI